VNTITIGASQTNTLPLDQTTTYLADAPTTTFALQWSFTLIAPLSKLNAVLTQLANAQQTIQPQSTGLSLTFYVFGLSSSQGQQPPSCPDATMVAEAPTQAQQVATQPAMYDLLRRRIGKYYGLAEAVSLIGGVKYTDCQPDTAGDQRGRVQALPDIEAEHEAQHGR
jgi:hypothetical protein